MIMNKSRTNLIAIGVALLALIMYLITLAPSVDFIDAGELAAVTHTLGIAHPTGYPLFTMMGWLWSHIPLGDEIYRMNVFSAVLCAVGVGIFFKVILFAISLHQEKPKVQRGAKKKPSVKAADKIPPDILKLLVSAFGALAIGFSETYWSTALSIEVYSLHCLMLSITIYLFLRSMFAKEEGVTWWKKNKFLLLGAFALGITFTNHLTTILLAPAFLYLFFAQNKFSKASWKKIGIMIPAFVCGLLPYLYLPLRAAASPSLNWGNPQTLERFLWHFSGKQYRVWIFSSTEAAGRQFKFFMQTFPAEFGYILLPLILIGIFYAFKIKKQIGIFLLLLFIGCVLYSINYDIHDIESYFLLAYITSGIYAAIGFYAIVGWWERRKNITYSAAVICIGILVGVLFGRVSERNNYLVEDYTSNMFKSLAPNALIISYQWDYFVSASYFYQKVKGVCRDVTVIDKELLRRSWYFEQIRHNYPDVYNKSKSEIDNFMIELRKFEHDEPYDPQTIESKYIALVNSFINKNYDARPVYITIEIEEQFAEGYFRIPEGLAFRLYKEKPPLDKKVFEDFTFRPFHRRGRLIDGIVGMYCTMLTSKAKYLYAHQDYKRAAVYFDRALTFDPANSETIKWQTINRGFLNPQQQ